MFVYYQEGLVYFVWDQEGIEQNYCNNVVPSPLGNIYNNCFALTIIKTDLSPCALNGWGRVCVILYLYRMVQNFVP